ncbi:SdrD B-like domain-containing protein, partial [Microcoleus sp. Pol17_C1]|uniref:SdrD B-like domain-containing protein n=1 Tax=unclassified Microcoleus TaxID=2642155 RepID=UPI002FD264B7
TPGTEPLITPGTEPLITPGTEPLITPGTEPLITFTGSIQGTKFTNDLNRNGIFEAGVDLPQPDVTIFLDQNNNGRLDNGELQTPTNSLGGYSFSNLSPATYTVQEIVPPGFTRVTPVQPVTVVANQTTNFDILNIAQTPPTVTGSISGRKFNDINANGRLDVGEPGIPGFTIYIDLNTNNIFDSSESSRLTDATGSYQFNDLQPGTYTLREVQQPGFVATQVPAPVTIPLSTSATVPNFTNINFGNRRDTGSISGRKFIDVNANRTFEPGTDQPQPNVTLFLDINNNGRLDIGDLQTQTDNLGGYSFSNLPPATYTVQEIVPAGFTRVTPVQAV